ncbi:MAG TPA: hypothetical protein RMH85_35955 [Polyangiaceae bacterium LLY-WYZ-15_(1-7)]|nr:hypothetical protein [Myxococcales bacterium]MAT24703.1 hypothetical protein [Sandaracinus sp.]HJK93695.1 hypothetical protein [Polyangiaceae bacterium LLY-WYZ-15_(1-7)]HJL02034.1 hypothetical protein [Polyangiaceae bacterium LLY-WYZ-15_(1-7)]HJL13936.1 hypothetical protein [Polyangiaceae bacterium LLY-WYZ-15_(1-7)]
MNPLRLLCGTLLLALALGCEDDPAPATPDVPEAPEPTPAPAAPEAPEPEPELENPVPVWESGAIAREVEAAHADDEGVLLLELGEDWTPYLFSERDRATGERLPNPYRATYLALARGEFPEDHHGERAERDMYLELYGIPPTLGLLRTRFEAASELECREGLDLQPLIDFDGFVAYRNNDRARRDARRFGVLERQVERMVERQGVESHEELDTDALDDRARARLRAYRDKRPEVEAIRAAQARLECEGYFEGKGRYIEGAMDWPTHEALAEFERRHRVYGWGFLGRDTLEMLRLSTMEIEREAVLRILTERAVHSAGVIEDGSRSTLPSGEPRTYRGADGERHPIPNLEAELRQRVIDAFGLDTPEGTLEWLRSLGELEPGQRHVVAIEAPELPEYYADEMDLHVQIDRGDVWYEFPYDAEGNERAQPVQRRPRITIFAKYRGQDIPLARFGTTIGGWRSEVVDGTVMWKYKMSEIGERVWARIVAAPVWLPPESTPPRELLDRNPRRGRRGEPNYVIDYHETGPSYASAYGLVAAYHQRFLETSDGIRLGGDEGIRTHGSVDYMSIMRRHSHGCHRMHNHLAVRLMSFVLARRPHRRAGVQQLAFRRPLVMNEGEENEETYNMEIDRGGYVYELVEPLRVNVLEGRIRGRRETPVEHAIPKYDDEVGAYVMPDGQWVTVDRMGTITPIDMPDAGADAAVDPDAGVPQTVENLLEALPMPASPVDL